jgi:cobalt-zinc-cadmium efflux system protein
MEHVPESVDFQAVGQDLRSPAAIRAVHNLHVWEISPGHIALSAHLEMTDLSNWPSVLRDLQIILREKHGIDHATLQPELTMLTPESFS